MHRALHHPSIRPVAQFLCNLAKLSFFLTEERLRASFRPTESISEQLKDVLLVSPVKDVTLGYFSFLQGPD